MLEVSSRTVTGPCSQPIENSRVQPERPDRENESRSLFVRQTCQLQTRQSRPAPFGALSLGEPEGWVTLRAKRKVMRIHLRSTVVRLAWLCVGLSAHTERLAATFLCCIQATDIMRKDRGLTMGVTSDQ